MDTIPSNTPQKQCSTCKQWLPATTEFFSRNKRGKYGLKSQCKHCQSMKNKSYRQSHPEIQQQYYIEHREEKLQYAAQYRTVHKEKHREYCKQYNIERREELKEKRVNRYNEHREEYKQQNLHNYRLHAIERRRYAARYRAEHPEQIKLYQETHKNEHRQWDAAHYREYKEEKRLYSIGYRQSHAEALKQSHKRYHQTEHGRIMARKHSHDRRARKRAVQGVYTVSQIQEQLKRQRYHCYYAACGHAKFEKKNGQYIYHIEHTFPLSRVMGTDIPANSIDYLVLACPFCNDSKKNKFPWEWPEGGRLL